VRILGDEVRIIQIDEVENGGLPVKEEREEEQSPGDSTIQFSGGLHILDTSHS